MNTFTCIMPGCDNQYTTEEEEAYYCESCQLHKKNVAKEIDKKFAHRDRNEKSELEIFEEQAHSFDKPDGTKIFLMRG